jgi:hypothetical protein
MPERAPLGIVDRIQIEPQGGARGDRGSEPVSVLGIWLRDRATDLLASSWDVQFFFETPWDHEEGALITPQVSGQGSTAFERTSWPGINEAEAGCPPAGSWLCLQ